MWSFFVWVTTTKWFCYLVNTYIDGFASAIGIPAYSNKYHIFFRKKSHSFLQKNKPIANAFCQ